MYPDSLMRVARAAAAQYRAGRNQHYYGWLMGELLAEQRKRAEPRKPQLVCRVQLKRIEVLTAEVA